MSSVIKGIDSFLDVLALIKEPAKFEAKVTELKQQCVQYQEVVEAVVKLSEVNDYTQSIKQREEASKALLSNANASAEDIISKAKEEATQLTAAAKEATKRVKEAQSALVEREAALKAGEATLAEGLKKLQESNADLSVRSVNLRKIEEAVEEKRKKLLAAIG